jgi:precorrin-2/cobalt-factor-2 C20-methyltransferase
MMHNEFGTLYAIGVGPGDPELMTLKSARLLAEVDCVFTAASPKNIYSSALDIARAHLPQDTSIVRLDFPMTRDAAIREKAWSTAARVVACNLPQGHRGAFLTLGDPLTYSTFGYLLKTLRQVQPGLDIQIVPGVTSYQGAAAATHTILMENTQNLLVISGINSKKELLRDLQNADRAVILKAYKNFPEIRDALREAGMLERAILVSRCGMKDESIVRDLWEITDTPPYFSLILITDDE